MRFETYDYILDIPPSQILQKKLGSLRLLGRWVTYQFLGGIFICYCFSSLAEAQCTWQTFTGIDHYSPKLWWAFWRYNLSYRDLSPPALKIWYKNWQSSTKRPNRYRKSALFPFKGKSRSRKTAVLRVSDPRYDSHLRLLRNLRCLRKAIVLSRPIIVLYLY